ncbi:STAS domain-containing protein [Desulfovibrio psychrotolerans]|uniref:Chemotaxis protein CheA n=1 Tax=Desulfovibrio psychrotolerans TaxID=415242 RepID=A0A7J0BQM0_9BACT|nr:STAS domain-containing protein [Desulfovibrio psychrotolerans]GFM35364.1 hypothetical protein DSM19430T_00480 [Desulfovibrio psychrotolerans]
MAQSLREVFWEQAEAALQGLEPYLLELEVTEGEADAELLGRVIRTVHGLRGGAELLGMERAVRLARMVECVFSMARDGALVLTQDIVRASLKAWRLFEEMVRLGMDGQEDMEDSLAYHQTYDTLAVLAKSGSELAEELETQYAVPLPDGTPALRVGRYELEKCLRDGSYLYLIEFHAGEDIVAKDNSPLSLLEYLQKSGHVLATHCAVNADVPVDSCLVGGGRLHVLFSTILEPDLVDAVFMMDRGRIHTVDVQAVLDGNGSWRNLTEGGYLSGDAEEGHDEPMEGVDELVQAYNLAMADLQEGGRIPFEPWDDYATAQTVPLLELGMPVQGGGSDEGGNGGTDELVGMEKEWLLPEPVFGGAGQDVGAMAGLEERVGKGVFADLAPVDDLMGDLVDNPLGDLAGDLAYDVTDKVTDDVADSFADSGDFAAAADGVGDASMMPEDAGSGAAEDYSAILLEAAYDELAGGIGDMPDEFSSEDAVSGTFEQDLQVLAEPDADLFMDSGRVPDLSYLDAGREDADSGGILLMLDDEAQNEWQVDAQTTGDRPDMTGTEKIQATLHGFAVSADGEGAVLLLDGDITVAHAGRLREALLDLMQEHASVQVDARAAEGADLTFVQVMLAARKTAETRGVALALKEPVGQAVAEVFRQCGLDVSMQRVGA